MLESEKREMIKRHLTSLPKSSDRKIAGLIGCTPREVGVVRRELLAKGKLLTLTEDDV